MKSSIPANLIARMKCINSFNDTMFQNSHKETDKLNRTLSIKKLSNFRNKHILGPNGSLVNSTKILRKTYRNSQPLLSSLCIQGICFRTLKNIKMIYMISYFLYLMSLQSSPLNSIRVWSASNKHYIVTKIH